MSGSLMGTRKGLVGNFRTIRKREGILLAGNQSILKKRRKKKEKNPTLGMTGIHGHRLSLAKAQPKIRTNGVAMDEVAIEIGTRVNTTTAADIRAHGRAPGFNGIRMTGDGKGEMVRAPRSIKTGIITELVHRIPIFVRMEYLKMAI